MQKSQEKIKYFVYCRKSSEQQERQALSIQSQIDRAKQLAKEQNLCIKGVFQESKSAFEPHVRPVFSDMVERIKAGKAQGIIAWHPDRLSRNEIDAAAITYMLRTEQLKDLKFGSYHFDNSPEGIWMLQMALSQSQYDSAKKGRDVKRGLAKKLEMGWIPGPPPLGYLNDKINKTIIKDPERFDLVKKMWDLMLTGNYTPPKILDIANNEWGFRTRKTKRIGGNPMSRSTVYKILTNPFYFGLIRYGGEEVPGKHPPMITLDEFNRAQKLLGRKGKPRPKKHEFSYTGQINCGECGCLITAETKEKLIKSTKEIKEYTYYHCTRKKTDVNCSQRKYIREENLEKQIDNILGSVTILPQFLHWALEALNEVNDQEIADRTKIYKSKQKAVNTAQKQLDELTRMRYRLLIDDDTFLKEKDLLVNKISRLKEDLRATEHRAENWLELTEKTFEFTTYARKWFAEGDLQAKREILSSLGTNMLLEDGVLAIELNEWLQPIQAEYSALEKEYLKTGLEPEKISQNTAKNDDLESIRLRWLRGLDSNQ